MPGTIQDPVTSIITTNLTKVSCIKFKGLSHVNLKLYFTQYNIVHLNIDTSVAELAKNRVQQINKRHCSMSCLVPQKYQKCCVCKHSQRCGAKTEAYQHNVDIQLPTANNACRTPGGSPSHGASCNSAVPLGVTPLIVSPSKSCKFLAVKIKHRRRASVVLHGQVSCTYLYSCFRWPARSTLLCICQSLPCAIRPRCRLYCYCPLYTRLSGLLLKIGLR